MTANEENLCEQAFMDLMQDYGVQDGTPEILAGQLQTMGITIHDTLPREADLDKQGFFVLQRSIPLAFIRRPKSLESGGIVVGVDRFDTVAPWTR